MEQYNPQAIENKWYQYWEENQLFSPDISDADRTYSIVIPPPNVTGSLHIGHALDNTLQDVLIRWKRMLGYKTLWLPGTDHAGIATQMVVERELRKKGIEREALGREAFVKEIWKWKEQSGNRITQQLRKLGASLDWTRERFTLDEQLSKAVVKTFVDWYEEGLIYRGSYIVNWCPQDKTALSDLEVDYHETQGSFTYIAYPLSDGSGEIVVATTRPETMLGDSAVAVNPKDERYQAFIGKTLRLPLVGREIPVIADEFVDPEFGTGAVKITPSHDPNDFHMGKRHQLPEINIFTAEAKLNDVFPPLEGLDRFAARDEVVKLLEKKGFLKKIEPHTHSVGHCQRCQTVIEPRISVQWFCKMKDMAEASLKAMQKGEIRFLPENQGKIFSEWMNNIQDWCLSRQLWWGHRIPAWYCKNCGKEIVAAQEPTACPECASTTLEEETDVLDTWFSSGLFPFSTMGWPEQTEDLKNFYPNSTLITGYDILFFWVARMVMMGIKNTGQVPFPEVYLHGLVRNEKGDKMSKTKGNAIDPLNIVEQYGADALRFTLTSLTSASRDMKLSEKVIEGNRNFINKIWNATRFVLFHHERLGPPKTTPDCELGIFDQWILGELENTVWSVDRNLAEYRFNEAAKAIYAFFWGSFCDWYLELIKPLLFGKLGETAQTAAYATLFRVLDESLRLLHPFMPFVTEELFSLLPGNRGSIMLADFPRFGTKKQTGTPRAEALIETITLVRNIRGENQIKPNAKLSLIVLTPSQPLIEDLTQFSAVVQALGGLKSIACKARHEKQDGQAHSVGKGFEVFLDLSEGLDRAAELSRLRKEQEKLEKKKAQIEGKLSKQSFLAKAPPEVVKKNQGELREITDKLVKIKEALAELERL